MLKRLVVVSLFLIFSSLFLVPYLNAEETPSQLFPIYTDRFSPDNHYIPSGYMGDYGDIGVDAAWMDNPHSGTTSIRIKYSAKASQGAGWAGIYWQNPANNWGEKKGGFNLSGMNQLTFWARGEKGGERIEEFKIGGISGKYPDSDEVSIGPIILGKEWEKYTINLVDADLSYISGGFCWVAKADFHPEGLTFYLDDIRYEAVPGLTAEAKAAEKMPFVVYFDNTSHNNHYIPSGWMGDYEDLKLNEGWTVNPHSGTTSIRIEYSAQASQGARWAGIYWQNPANNWGEKKGGFDLSGATKLTFWARGEKGGERIEEFKMGGITGEYPDSDTAGIGPVLLTKEWKQYTINLEGKDLSYISGGFVWATNIDVNPEGCVFYLDDIRYE